MRDRHLQPPQSLLTPTLPPSSPRSLNPDHSVIAPLGSSNRSHMRNRPQSLPTPALSPSDSCSLNPDRLAITPLGLQQPQPRAQLPSVAPHADDTTCQPLQPQAPIARDPSAISPQVATKIG